MVKNAMSLGHQHKIAMKTALHASTTDYISDRPKARGLLHLMWHETTLPHCFGQTERFVIQSTFYG